MRRLSCVVVSVILTGSGAAHAMAAGEWLQNFSAPEIDGPAGISALALLVTAGVITYNRWRR